MPLLKPHSPRLRARGKNAYELPLSERLHGRLRAGRGVDRPQCLGEDLAVPREGR